MDDKWFRLQQKKAGITADEIAAIAGRDRSIVSRILNGHQAMSIEWARAFSKALDVPLDIVLQKAGVTDRPTAQHFAPGFSESDAIAWIAAQGADDRRIAAIGQAMGERPGVDIWRVKLPALAFMGYFPGDYILVDSHAAERCKAGDAVVAQVYDNAKGSASTILRRFEPPVLVAASPNPDDRRVYVIDGTNVVVRGKIVASWRI